MEGVPLVSWHFGDCKVSRGWPEAAGRSIAELSGLREDCIRGPELEGAEHNELLRCDRTSPWKSC